MLILGTPDYGKRLWRTLEWIYGKVFPGGYVKEHINRYTYDTLREELEGDLGLDVLECQYVGRSEMIFKARIPVRDRVPSSRRPNSPPDPAGRSSPGR